MEALGKSPEDLTFPLQAAVDQGHREITDFLLNRTDAFNAAFNSLDDRLAEALEHSDPVMAWHLTDRASLIRGGDSGVPTFVPGRGEESQLLRHVTDQVEDMEMPPLRKRRTYPALGPEQVRALATWIDEGAAWPEGVVLGD